MSEQKKIDPRHLHIDSMGHHTRQWFARLPQGMMADDLKDPAVWSRVQGDRNKALRRHDRLYLVDYDEAFALDARVTDATGSAAVLALQKIISFPERITPLFNDGTYCVKWGGEGFYAMRLTDHVQMGPCFGSEALAIRHIQNLYPQAVR